MMFTDGGGKIYYAKVYEYYELEKRPNIQWEDRPVYREEWNTIYSQIMNVTDITAKEKSILRGFVLRCGPKVQTS